jgi:hypothetical protein
VNRDDDQQQNPDRLRQRLDESDRRAARAAQEDVVVEFPRRLFLRSASGTYWQIGVSDAGVLTATNAGATL